MYNKTFSYKLAVVLFIFPFIVFTILFGIAPIIGGVTMGFMNIPIGKVFGNFIGFKNFQIVLHDPIFWSANINSIKLVTIELLISV